MSIAADPVFRPQIPQRREGGPLSLPAFLWMSWRDPLSIWSDRHFDLPQVHGQGVFGEMLVVSHPAGVRHVLTENASNYVKADLQRRVLGPLLEEGLLLTEGDDWRRARRIMAPLFTPARIQGLNRRMAEVCEARVEGWRLAPQGRLVDMDSEMSGLTFDILSATLFSDDLGGEAAGFERALNRYLSAGARIDPLDVMGAPDWAPRLGRIASRRSAVFFEQRVTALVTARRARMETGATAPPDLLTALLGARDEGGGAGLSDSEVAANILTFILAGHETTARALGWTLHLLTRQPEVMARVQAEADGFDVDRPDWAERMPWLRASLDEAMRLFPPAPTMARRALAADEIGGQAIGAGATVVISPWVLQRHRSLWDDPDAFRPERFLPENRKRIDRYAYIPFSAGPRVCIGGSFAIQEALIALAVILGAAEVEAITRTQPRPVHKVTLRARRPIELRVRKRLKPA